MAIFPDDVTLPEVVSKLHLESKKVITSLERENQLLKRELEKSKKRIKKLEEGLASKNNQIDPSKRLIEEFISEISSILNLDFNLSENNLIQKLKTKIDNQNEIIEELKQKLHQESENTIQFQSNSELFQEDIIISKIKQVYQLVPYKEDHIWDIISILITYQELTLDKITLYTKIKKSSTSAILGKRINLNLITKRRRGRKVLYSLNISYIKGLIKHQKKKGEIQTLKKEIKNKTK